MACDKKYLKNQKECNVTFILSAAAAAGANEVWLSGDFNSWSSGNSSYKFSFNGNVGTLSVTLEAKSTYNFKIVQDGTWRTNSNAGTMKRDNCSDWDFNTQGGDNNNTKIITDIKGTYIFKYNKSTYTLSITYPNIDKVFIKGGMNSWGSDECTNEGSGIFKKSYSGNDNTEFKFVANDGSNWNGEGLYNTMSVDASKNTNNLKLTRNNNDNTKITNTAGTAFDIVINTNTGKYWIEAPSCTAPQKPTIQIDGKTGTISTCNTNGTLTIDANHVADSYRLFTKSGSIYTDKGIITDKSKTIETSGTYVVRAYNGDCMTESDEITFTKNTLPTISASTLESQTICENSSTTLSVKEGMTSYLWSTEATTQSINVSEAGTYTVVAEDSNGCESNTLTFTITVNALPNAPDPITFGPVCSGVSFELPEITGKWYASEQDEDPIAKTITGGITTQTTYYASAIENNCESTGRTPLTVDVKNKPAVPTLTAENNVTEIVVAQTTATLLVGNIEQDATYTLYKDGEPTQNTGTSFIVSEGGTYKVVASNSNECGTSESSEITITACTPISNVEWSITNGEKDVYCSGDEVQVRLNYNGDTATEHTWNLNGVTVSNEDDIASGTIYTIIINQSGSVQLTLTGCAGEPYSTSMQFLVSSETVAPTIGISKNSICEGDGVQTITVNGYNPNYTYALYKDGVKQNTTISNTGTFTVNTTGEYTVTAKNCVESTPSNMVSLTVNPLPTIRISGSETAVLYEDVTLTAIATDGATVKWYEGVVEKGEGLTYVVTSETATSKTITAKAFLNGCESNPASHLVNFSAENCASDNKIIIECTSTTGVNLFCYAFYGDNKTKIFGEWPGTQGNANGNTYTWTIEDKDDVTIIFNAGKNTNQTDDLTGHEKGKKYYYTFDSSKSKDNNPENYTLTKTEDILRITAPAVKTVSATSEEGSGVVNFTGKIIKTGCADNSKIYYGYQYRLETDDWPTTGVQAGNDKLQLKSLTNASETALHYEFSSGDITLDNGKYVFRAYIINGYNFTNGNYDQGVYYGIDIPVTVSTQKDPIRNLQVKYADDKGVVLQDQNVTYCVGDDAYIKLIYDGSKLKPEEDEINISSTLENTFTLVEGEADDLYTFVVKGNETITVIAKNEENTVQGIDPATNSIDISTYVQPQTPSITLPEEMAVVCSNGVGATITVNEPQEGITYSLYIDGVAEAAQTKTPTEGTLQFTEIKTAGTYYVTAVNPSCPKNIAKSLDSKSIEVIDASANTIAIEPDEDTTNPWVPVKLKVTKNSVYDYTLVCKQDVTDVTESVVINKKDDIYTIKFPKPKGADITDDGQVEFDDIEYTVIVSLDGNVECGTTSATSEITLTQLVEDCTNN